MESTILKSNTSLHTRSYYVHVKANSHTCSHAKEATIERIAMIVMILVVKYSNKDSNKVLCSTKHCTIQQRLRICIFAFHTLVLFAQIKQCFILDHHYYCCILNELFLVKIEKILSKSTQSALCYEFFYDIYSFQAGLGYKRSAVFRLLEYSRQYSSKL